MCGDCSLIGYLALLVSFVIFGCTTAPVDTKFVAFQREWNTIDKSLEMRSLPITCLWLQIRRDQVIAVISEMLSDKKSFLRDDYR